MFGVERDKAGEDVHRCLRAQQVIGFGCLAFSFYIERCIVEHSFSHLGGYHALPDKLIQPVLVKAQKGFNRGGLAHDARGADGLVRLLRPFHLAGECPRSGRKIVRAVLAAYEFARFGHSLRGYVSGVGTHVGDKAHAALVSYGKAFI